MDTDNSMILTRGKGFMGSKGVRHIMMEDDVTLSGGHTMQHTDHVSQNVHLKSICSY